MRGYTVTLTDAEYDAMKARIAYLESALKIIADGTICPDLFPNETDENVIAAKTAMVTAIAALEHSESETEVDPVQGPLCATTWDEEMGTKFTGRSRDVPCTHCGQAFMEHSNFDLSCNTSKTGAK